MTEPEMKKTQIRPAAVDDADAILAVYAPYVRNTAVSFEYDVPDSRSFRRRIEGILREYPCLVAEEDGKILGYVYAGPFHSRAAYKHSAEISVYLAENCCRRGLGTRLYQELERRLVSQNVFVLYACIASTDRRDDPFLTDRSIRFHEKMGYRTVGEHHFCGYKFDRWYNMIWMEKTIADLPARPGPFIPFPDVLVRPRPENREAETSG